MLDVCILSLLTLFIPFLTPRRTPHGKLMRDYCIKRVAKLLPTGHDVIPVKYAIPYLKKRGYDEK